MEFPAFLAIIAVLLTAIIGSAFVMPILKYRARKLELISEQTAEKAAQYAAKTERLEQRVAVLERILTDRSADLANEIERLRDRPLN
jgi:hypothetical protein